MSPKSFYLLLISNCFVGLIFCVRVISVQKLSEPRKFIDIYTNGGNADEILDNYRSFSNPSYKRTNTKYLEQIIPVINNRNDYGYNGQNRKYPSKFSNSIEPDNDDKLISDFGAFMNDEGNKIKKYDKIKYYVDDRRPRFKTQKYNWTIVSQSNESEQNDSPQKISFSRVEKVSKPTEEVHKLQSISTTKERINDMLKKYLNKLYRQKFQQNSNKTSTPNRYKYVENGNHLNISDDAYKSKLFDETIWQFKNKTKLLASKLFSLFTVIQFENSQCTTSNTAGEYEGICYTQQECTSLSGTAIGECANGYGVCCVFKGTCGDSASQNCSYFESPNYPNFYPSDTGSIVPTTISPVTPDPRVSTPDPRLQIQLYYGKKSNNAQWARQGNDVLSCMFSVEKLNDDIQQMRIDFIDMDLLGPTNGTCMMERFMVSGDGLTMQIPVICGYNSGQHMYVDVSNLDGPLTLSVLSTVMANKRFKIRVCQFDSAASCSTSNCLQYYTEESGMISSFNYDQAAMYNRSTPGYFNNLNYAICIRREPGYCSITYTNVRNGMEYPFQLRNVDENGMLFPPGQAGADVFNCPDDYITIDGTRLCGDKFNDGKVNDDFTMNAPVTDTSSGPIVIPVRTDGSVTGIGFKLFYMQNPCPST